MNDSRLARAAAELFSRELVRRRALAPGLSRLAVAFRVRGADGVFRACTSLVEDHARVVEGELIPVGHPAVWITTDAVALADLFAGRSDALDLARTGRLMIEGPAELISALSACFADGESPLTVRIKR